MAHGITTRRTRPELTETPDRILPDFSARANQFALLPDFVYNNVVGSLPGANDLNLFVGMLDTGAETKASLAILAAESSFNLANINLVGLVRTGIEFS